MRRLLTTALTLAALAMAARTALGFCGFYVAKADTKLFNQASQVVLVRHDDKTVITMSPPSCRRSRSTSPSGPCSTIWTPIRRRAWSSTSTGIRAGRSTRWRWRPLTSEATSNPWAMPTAPRASA